MGKCGFQTLATEGTPSHVFLLILRFVCELLIIIQLDRV